MKPLQRLPKTNHSGPTLLVCCSTPISAGQIFLCMRIPDLPQSRVEFFWSHVNKSGPVPTHVLRLGPCWEWTHKIDDWGYGRMHAVCKRDGVRVSRLLHCHRVSYFLFRGIDPEGFFVIHRCDNPRCVNPHHLRMGTPQDNVDDMVEKGRAATGDRNGARIAAVSGLSSPNIGRHGKHARGDAHYRAKLTSENVRQIRSLAANGSSASDLSKMFSVTEENIRAVLRGKTWKHV